MTFHMPAKQLFATGCAILLASLAAYAQMPQLANARTETRAASSDFPAQLRDVIRHQEDPAWLGYAVAAVAGDHAMCCGDYGDGRMNGCGACQLEDENGHAAVESDKSAVSGTVKLEEPRQLVVMIRAAHETVERIRTFSEDCRLDAGGLALIWFSGVSARQSVAALGAFVNSGADADLDGDHPGAAALGAIALTGDPSADAMLGSFVAPSQPETLREHAAFWLGATRGHAGFQTLQRLARTDPSESLRAKVAFDLYVSKDAEATAEIIRLAKNDQSSRVREQAIFWIAQKAGKKAAVAITDAIENDPNTEVKKRAVFALSQLPRDEGVPLLIEVAKTNTNPAVRKQAIFWLGQSHDPRALAFFEEILAR